MIYESTISEDLSDEAILKALKEEDYGRCLYVCDNDQVSSQVIIISFLIRSGTVSARERTRFL
jgi:hypothetical protein